MLGILYALSYVVGKAAVGISDANNSSKSRNKALLRGEKIYTDANRITRNVANGQPVYQYKNLYNHWVWAEVKSGKVVQDDTAIGIEKNYKSSFHKKEEKYYNETLENYFYAVEHDNPYFTKYDLTFDFKTGKSDLKYIRMRTSDGLILKNHDEKININKYMRAMLPELERNLCIYDNIVGSDLYEKETGLCVGITGINEYFRYQPAFVKYNIDIINSTEVQNKMHMNRNQLLDYAKKIGAVLEYESGYVGKRN